MSASKVEHNDGSAGNAGSAGRVGRVGSAGIDGIDGVEVGAGENDFQENDYLYINQRDATFKDESAAHIMHTSKFAMGVDVADATNDGFPEIMTVEHKEVDDLLVVTLQEGKHDGSFIPDILIQNSFRLKMFKEEEIDLEDVFMGITKGITN